MTKKIYRTANGKMVDLGALQLQNENIRAVGNMGVNARGDVLDSRNKTIDTRNRQVANQYRKQTNVSDTPVQSSQKTASVKSVNSDAIIPQQSKSQPTPQEEKSVVSSPASGLAAAIARAREIKQEPLSPAPSRSTDGPTKI